MKKYFVTGLVVLLPLALTFWICGFIFGLLTEPFSGLAQSMLTTLGVTSPDVLAWVGKVLALLFLFGLLLSIGAVGHYFFFGYLMQISDAILHRIPIVGSVYKTSREFVETLTSSNRSFQQVVFIPFPHPQSWAVAFLSRPDVEIEGRIPVFVPTTPNPTSGFLVMIEKEKIIHLDMKVDDALRFVISCGVLVPEIKRLPS